MSAFRMRQEPQQPDYDLLPPAQRQTIRQRPPQGRIEDVSDAQFVVIEQAQRPFAGNRSNDNSLSAGRQGRASRLQEWLLANFAGGVERFLERFSDRAFAVLVALIFGAVFMLASGLAAMQAQVGAVSVAPLDITHASLTPQDSNGMRVLLINGIVENRARNRQPVPQIRADLLSDGRLIASTLIDAPMTSLDVGHSRGFSARIPHPGGKLPELRLSLVENGVLAQ